MTEPVDRAAGTRPELADPGAGWSEAFDEAWASWRAGNFGIGAVLLEPSTGAIVSTGRNRVGQSERGPA